MFSVTTLTGWQHERNPIALNFINPRTKHTSKSNSGMSRNCTGLGNGILLMRRPLWEKLWAKQHSFHSPTQPRETPLRQQSLLHTSPGICSPQLSSGAVYGWDGDFPWQGRVHGWGSCKSPSPSGPWALVCYSHFSVLVSTTSHARVCSWASLTRCLSSVNRCKCLFISAEAVHHSL